MQLNVLVPKREFHGLEIKIEGKPLFDTEGQEDVHISGFTFKDCEVHAASIAGPNTAMSNITFQRCKLVFTSTIGILKGDLCFTDCDIVFSRTKEAGVVLGEGSYLELDRCHVRIDRSQRLLTVEEKGLEHEIFMNECLFENLKFGDLVEKFENIDVDSCCFGSEGSVAMEFVETIEGGTEEALNFEEACELMGNNVSTWKAFAPDMKNNTVRLERQVQKEGTKHWCESTDGIADLLLYSMFILFFVSVLFCLYFFVFQHVREVWLVSDKKKIHTREKKVKLSPASDPKKKNEF